MLWLLLGRSRRWFGVFFSSHWAWLALWIFAIALRLIYLRDIIDSDLATALLGDARAYDEWGVQIAEGDWIGHKAFYQAPLYPYFLGTLYALIGRDLFIVRLVQLFLGATSCVMMGRAVGIMTSRPAGLTTAAFMAVCPTLMFFDLLVQKAVLDVFCFSLLWLSFAEAAKHSFVGRWWLPVGSAFGLLCLTRENAFAILPVIGISAWLRAGGKGVSMLAVGLTLILLPVVSRNAFVSGEFHLTTSQAGPNFFIGNNAKSNGTYQPLLIGRGDAIFERSDAVEIAEEAIGRTLSAGEVSSYWMRRSFAYIQENPWHWLTLLARKWFLVWNAVELSDTEEQSAYEDLSFVLRWLAKFFHFGVLCPIGIAGMIWSIQKKRMWPLAASTFVYAGSVVAFYVLARYRLLLYPLMIAFAATAIVAIPERWTARRSLSTLFGIGIAIAATVFVNWPSGVSSTDRVLTWRNLGQYFSDMGNYQRARYWLDRALTIYPDSVDANAIMGYVLGRSGDFQEATDHLRKALRLAPTYPDAELNLGNALMFQGLVEDAVSHFEVAMRQSPNSAEVRYNLGNAMLHLGRNQDAEAKYRESIGLDPTLPGPHNNLSTILFQTGRLEEALNHMLRFAELQPQSVDAYANLGVGWREQGNHAEAKKAFERAIELDRLHLSALMNLSWLLATCPDENFRDGERAVQLATQANQLSDGNHPMILRSLAASFAEVGKFSDAERVIDIAMARANSNQILIQRFSVEREQYQKGLPIRD